MTEPLAALDIGSNTIRLLVGRVHGEVVDSVLDDSDFVRLGKGVDKTGKLEEDRIDAGVASIVRLATVAQARGVVSICAVATSAVRDASNGPEFLRRVREQTGIEVQIIPGDREAELTFIGATIGVDLSRGVVVCDLGGGSAELISADSSGIRWRTSEPLGSGRLTERFIHHDPAEHGEIDRVRDCVRAVLATLEETKPRSLVCTGGTATHVALVSGSSETMTSLDDRKLHDMTALISALTVTEIVERYHIGLERAQVLPAGVATLEAIARFYHPDQIIITRHGIREGILLDAAKASR